MWKDRHAYISPSSLLKAPTLTKLPSTLKSRVVHYNELIDITWTQRKISCHTIGVLRMGTELSVCLLNRTSLHYLFYRGSHSTDLLCVSGLKSSYSQPIYSTICYWREYIFIPFPPAPPRWKAHSNEALTLIVDAVSPFPGAPSKLFLFRVYHWIRFCNSQFCVFEKTLSRFIGG